MEDLSLIDISAEDDFLLELTSPPPHPDPPHAGSSGLDAEASYVVPVGVSLAAAPVQVPERSESPKQRKPKSGVNLRKSLAWDNALLTSEGLLDTEELGIANSAYRKRQGSRLLPGIAEEMRNSGESTTSTLESESFVMETTETELFDNVRASIQRTLGKPDKGPAASSKILKDTANVPLVAARMGVDRMPQAKIRATVSVSHGVDGKQRTQVTLKEPTAARVVLPGAAEAKPSSRPPRALPRVATMRVPNNTAATSGISEKRSSDGGVATRQVVGKSASASRSMQSRPAGVTKSASTSKSGAFSSAATSSHSVSMGTPSGTKTKSPTLINKNRTAQRMPIRSSSRSDISKVNPAKTSRSQIPTKSHGEHASPSISPSSSVDSMCSVISGVSTASTVGKMSHTSESFSTRSSSLSPSLRKSNDCPATKKSRPPVVIEGQPTGEASGDGLKATKEKATHGSCKPSGLRRPTPKIGYFDAEKSIDQNIGAHVHVQPTKAQYSPAALNPSLSSSQKSNPASSTFDQQESKPTTVPQEEINPYQTKASPSLQLGVAPMKVESSNVTEDEACIRQTEPVVAVNAEKGNMPALYQNQPNGDVRPLKVELWNQKIGYFDAEESVDQNTGGEVHVSPPATPSICVSSTQMINRASSTFCQQEQDLMAALHENINPSHTKASPPSPPPGVALIEEETTKMTEHETCLLETSPVIMAETAKDNIPALHHNIKDSGDVSPLTVGLLSQKPCSASKPTAKPDEKICPSQTKALPSVPLGVVTEHEECVLQNILEAAMENIPALHNGNVSPLKEIVLHHNMQANCPMSPLTMLTQKLSSISLGESINPHEESSPCQVKTSPSVPLGVVQMEVEPYMVTEHEACVLQTIPEAAKENMLASHENIQANGDLSPSKEKNLVLHQNKQVNYEMSPLTRLTQKLSSISLGEASDSIC